MQALKKINAKKEGWITELRSQLAGMLIAQFSRGNQGAIGQVVTSLLYREGSLEWVYCDHQSPKHENFKGQFTGRDLFIMQEVFIGDEEQGPLEYFVLYLSADKRMAWVELGFQENSNILARPVEIETADTDWEDQMYEGFKTLCHENLEVAAAIDIVKQARPIYSAVLVSRRLTNFDFWQAEIDGFVTDPGLTSGFDRMFVHIGPKTVWFEIV